jgi:hypothetical protein
MHDKRIDFLLSPLLLFIELLPSHLIRRLPESQLREPSLLYTSSSAKGKLLRVAVLLFPLPKVETCSSMRRLNRQLWGALPLSRRMHSASKTCFRKDEVIGMMRGTIDGSATVTTSGLLEAMEKFEATQLRLQYSYHRDAGPETANALDWVLVFRLCWTYHQPAMALRLYTLMINHTSKPYSQNRRPIETEKERQEEVTPAVIQKCRNYVLLSLEPKETLRLFVMWYAELSKDEVQAVEGSEDAEHLSSYVGRIRKRNALKPGCTGWGAVARALYALGQVQNALDTVKGVADAYSGFDIINRIRGVKFDETLFIPLIEQCGAAGDTTNLTRLTFLLYQNGLRPMNLAAVTIKAALRDSPSDATQVSVELQFTNRITNAVEVLNLYWNTCQDWERRELAIAFCDGVSQLAIRQPAIGDVATAAIVRCLCHLKESEVADNGKIKPYAVVNVLNPCVCWVNLMECYLAMKNPLRTLEIYHAAMRDVSSVELIPSLFQMAMRSCALLRDADRADQIHVERENQILTIRKRLNDVEDDTHPLYTPCPKTVGWHMIAKILAADAAYPQSRSPNFFVETVAAVLSVMRTARLTELSPTFPEACVSFLATVLEDPGFVLPPIALLVIQLVTAQLMFSDSRGGNPDLLDLTPRTLHRLIDAIVQQHSTKLPIPKAEIEKIENRFECAAAVASATPQTIVHSKEVEHQTWVDNLKSRTLLSGVGVDYSSKFKNTTAILVTPSAIGTDPEEQLVHSMMELAGEFTDGNRQVIFVVPWRSMKRLGAQELLDLVSFAVTDVISVSHLMNDPMTPLLEGAVQSRGVSAYFLPPKVISDVAAEASPSALERDWSQLLRLTKDATGSGLVTGGTECLVWTEDEAERDVVNRKLSSPTIHRELRILPPPLHCVDMRRLRAEKALQSMKQDHVIEFPLKATKAEAREPAKPSSEERPVRLSGVKDILKRAKSNKL